MLVWGLANYGQKTSKRTFQQMRDNGECCSYATTVEKLSKRPDGYVEPVEILGILFCVMIFIDNYQQFLKIKLQRDGHSSSSKEATLRYARRVNQLVPPENSRFPIDEGQPKLTSVDQKIPAVMTMLPYELVVAKGVIGFLFLFENIKDLNDNLTALCDFLNLPVDPIPFHYLNMKPTDGKRADAYKQCRQLAREIHEMSTYLSGKSDVFGAFSDGISDDISYRISKEVTSAVQAQRANGLGLLA